MNNRAEIVFRLAPDIYNENENMLDVYGAQKIELGNYEAIIYRIFLNNYVKYADLEGVRRLEAIFYIKANEATETLEFRKARLLNKFAFLPPFTKIFLKRLLNNIFGEGNVEVFIYYDERRLEIDIENAEIKLINQTMKDIRQIIPANMILEKYQVMPYTHRYLRNHYTHEEMQQFTQGELSQYAD